MKKNFAKLESAQKYIEVELCNQNSIDKFVKEVSDANIYDLLNLVMNRNSNYKYKIYQNFCKQQKAGISLKRLENLINKNI